MFKALRILDEKDPHLRRVCKDATLPLSKEEKKLVQQAIDHLTYSQIETYERKYHLRPGMGLAFPQLGIDKRVIIVVYEKEEDVFENYVVVNPKVISHSEEIIAAEAGEGCLSVNREVEGHVPRYARITIEGFDEDGNPVRFRGREDLAIAFQHEMDHLDGILFFDRIDKKKPFFSEREIRLI